MEEIMHFVKQISLVVSLIVAVAAAACGANQQGTKSPETVVSESSETTHQTSSSTTYAPQAPAPTPHADLPLECRHANMTVIKEDPAMIQCSCRGDLTEARWTSVKSKDPVVQNQCLAGLYYEWQIMRLPIRGPRAVDILAGTASSASPPPVPPEPVGRAPQADVPPVPIASGTAATVGDMSPVPAPTASASATTTTSYKKTVKATKVYQDGDLLIYQCEEDVVAKRLFQQKGNRIPTEIQTCGGNDKVVCLTEPSKQLDTSIPPCACKSGQAPSKSFGNIWMCD